MGTMIEQAKGAKVLVNGELPGTVIEAERMPAPTVGGRPFTTYLVQLEGGAIEGFTGEYLTWPGARIEVTRGAIASRTPGNRRPISNFYECHGPDGTKFTNTSIGTLRTLLRQRYGRDVVIVETWKDGA